MGRSERKPGNTTILRLSRIVGEKLLGFTEEKARGVWLHWKEDGAWEGHPGAYTDEYAKLGESVWLLGVGDSLGVLSDNEYCVVGYYFKNLPLEAARREIALNG